MKVIPAFFFIFLVGYGCAQQVPLDKFKNMSMRSIGPALMSGRVTAIDVSETHDPTIWIGTASGGVWRSVNQGTTWEPVFDKQPVVGIGALKVDPSNPDVVWVGTGEGNPRNSQTSGRGIYRTPDGGRTWSFLGLEGTKAIHRLCISPKESARVFVGALGSSWGPNPERGVFKTSDNGRTWKKILYVNDSTGCADLVMDPSNPDKLFAAMWQFARQPWFFTSGGKGSGLHMTLDGGESWTRLTEKNGLPSGKLGRIGLAIAPGNSKVVYALIEGAETALYRSDNGGFDWLKINDKDVDDRPFYYNEIYVDPVNENHLIYLHSVVSESIDGGKSWTVLLPYSGVHPDHHAFWWSSAEPDFMIEGNDGGLNLSRDGGRSWNFAANLPLGQFYHINYDLQTPYNVYGGMQDNGSWKGPGYVWHSDGILSSDWQELLFGDGFDVVPDAVNPRFVYAMSQGGYLCRVDAETGEERFVRPFSGDVDKLRFHWNSGIAQDPHNPSAIFFGSQYLHYSNDAGMSWTTLSPDLTTNDQEKQKAASSGGLTIDATSAENHCTILSIAPSPVNPDLIWVGTDDGMVQLTTDRGETWKNCTRAMPDFPAGGWVAQIVASQLAEGEVWVVVNNYRQNDWKPYLYYSADYGRSWKNLVDLNKVSGHCLSVAPDFIAKNLLFLGTENGLYISIDGGSEWTRWTESYPAVATQDLRIHPKENDLLIATFGRAIYILDDISPLRKLAEDRSSLLSNKLTALETPTAFQAYFSRHRGERFPADSRFEGDNKAPGAMLSYFFRMDEPRPEAAPGKKAEGRDKPEVEDPKVKVIILNEAGDTVRWLTHVPDTGLNRINWNFDSNSVRFPSREKVKKDADPPGGGLNAPPGNYKVVFRFGKVADSTYFQVKSDPRLPFNFIAWQTQKDLDGKWRESVELAERSFTALQKARATIHLVESALEDSPEVEKKTLLSQADSLLKSIQRFEDKFVLPENAKGILDDQDLITSQLYTVSALIHTGSVVPGNNASNAVDILTKQVRLAADEINLFFETEWNSWRQNVEKGQVSVFREFGKL